MDDPHPGRQSTPRRRLREAQLYDKSLRNLDAQNNDGDDVEKGQKNEKMDEVESISRAAKMVAKNVIDKAVSKIVQRNSGT